MTDGPAPSGAEGVILHAGCVAHAGRAVLIRGASGTGKSLLALRMLALGARLVSDDRTRLVVDGGRLIASCPTPAISGLIEARGVGLLRVPVVAQARVAILADLDRLETERLPPDRRAEILGVPLPLVLQSQNGHLAEALLLWLAGAEDPTR